MQNKALPLLYIRSPYKGLVKINESPAGETGTYSITTPLSPGSPVFIAFSPLENEPGFILLPFTRKISLLGEKVTITQNDGLVRICIWPDNVYELTLIPPALPVQPNTDIYPKVVTSFDFYIRAQPYTAFLYKDTAYTFAVEDANSRHLVFAHPLTLPVETAEIAVQRVSGLPIICVSGTTKKNDHYVVFVNVRPEFSVAAETVCLSYKISEREAEIVTKNGTSLFETKQIFTMRDNRLALYKKTSLFGGRGQAQLTAMEIIVNFIDAVHLNQRDTALSFLTPSLKEGLAFDALIDFFGDFSCISEPLTTVAGDRQDTTVALKYDSSDHVQIARMFCFDMYTAKNGLQLVDNIREP